MEEERKEERKKTMIIMAIVVAAITMSFVIGYYLGIRANNYAVYSFFKEFIADNCQCFGAVF